MKIKLWSKPKSRTDKSIPVEFNFKPGITMLIGSNGSGKTTTLKQINSIFNNGSWNDIEDNYKIKDKYLCYLYDNEKEQRDSKQEWLNTGKTDRLAYTFGNSEGQDMYDYLYYKTADIGKFIREAKQLNKNGVILLFDGLDSGLSLDILETVKTKLLDFIIDTDNKEDFEIYIICSSNSYEFCDKYNCLDVNTRENIIFNNYDEYKNYFVKE